MSTIRSRTQRGRSERLCGGVAPCHREPFGNTRAHHISGQRCRTGRGTVCRGTPAPWQAAAHAFRKCSSFRTFFARSEGCRHSLKPTHNPKAAGSNPAPATTCSNQRPDFSEGCRFCALSFMNLSFLVASSRTQSTTQQVVSVTRPSARQCNDSFTHASSPRVLSSIGSRRHAHETTKRLGEG